MKSVTAIAALSVQLVSAAAAASNPCIEFLEEHLGDPGWEQACMKWLASIAPSSSPLSGAPSILSGAGTSSVTSVRHLSASNLTLAADNQLEAFIAADRNSSRVFAFVMTAPFVNGLFAAYSADLGTTWTPSKIAVGPGGDIPAGRADPWAVFGDAGKLFISYIYEFNLDEPTFGIPLGQMPTIVAKSADGGATFDFVEALGVETRTDRGSMATGPGGAVADGSLWVIYRDLNAGPGTGSVVVRGAALAANGDPIEDFCGAGTGYFCVEQTIAVDVANTVVFPGHVAVGPNGEVLATYKRFNSATAMSGPIEIFAALDPDGLGSAQTFPPTTPPATNPVLTTNVGFSDSVPPQPIRRIFALANLAWNHATGRIYLVSTTEQPQEFNETDIVLLTSDNNGATWSAPKRVNDDPPPTLDGMGNPLPDEVRSQFFPHVSVDPKTGHVIVAWHDPRNRMHLSERAI